MARYRKRKNSLIVTKEMETSTGGRKIRYISSDCHYFFIEIQSEFNIWQLSKWLLFTLRDSWRFVVIKMRPAKIDVCSYVCVHTRVYFAILTAKMKSSTINTIKKNPFKIVMIC